MSSKATKERFLGAIDQGTSSTRFIIFNGVGEVVASHQLEISHKHPHAGWHEHDPRELVASVTTCIAEATRKFVDDGSDSGGSGHAVSDIEAVGLTNQRETTIVWDTRTGEPLYNAIVWTDTRTGALVRELQARTEEEGGRGGGEGAAVMTAEKLRQTCGLPLSTYPSAVKLLWLLRNVDAVRTAYDERRLAFGTVDSWLLYNLNGGGGGSGDSGDNVYHVTDVTNASRTMLLNLHTLTYDDDLLAFFGLDRAHIKIPAVAPSADRHAFGKIAAGPLRGTPITGCLGDQSAALVGQMGLEPGMAKNTYGTGCFLLQNVGSGPLHNHHRVTSKHGLLATVAYQLGADAAPCYALEGSIAAAGSAVRFLAHNLGLLAHANDVDELASSVADSGGVVFVTAFSGLFAPYWISDIKGTMFGITQHTQRGHIARATLEATCLQTRAIVEAMQKDSGHAIDALEVDGGLSASDLCMQIQADVLGIPVRRPAMRETTALGASMAAGIAAGVWKDLAELKQVEKPARRVFGPRISAAERDRLYQRWQRAVDMAKGWEH